MCTCLQSRHCLCRLILCPSFQAVEYDNRFFVNPGSATGAWIGNINGYVPKLNEEGF